MKLCTVTDYEKDDLRVELFLDQLQKNIRRSKAPFFLMCK